MVTSPADDERIAISCHDNWVHLPAFVAREAGLFSKQGLNADLVAGIAGEAGIDALEQERVQVAQVVAATVVIAALKGRDVIAIGSWLNSMPNYIISRGELSDHADFKGKRFVCTVRGGDQMALLFFLGEKGLHYDDVLWVPTTVVDHDRVIKQIKESVVDVGMVVSPWHITAKRAGLEICKSFPEAGVRIPVGTINVKNSSYKRNRPLFERVVRAYKEAVHYAKSHKQETIAIAKKCFRQDDPELLEAGYHDYAAWMNPDLCIEPDGVEKLLKKIEELEKGLTRGEKRVVYDDSIPRGLAAT
jgi:ABC-type nitrate/sulfonate/bicarbonate transport system substrate-binding protein